MRSKKALKNIIVSLILQFITVISGFIVPKLIIQNYGSNVNGLISSITQFLAYITLLEAGIAPVVRAQLYKPIAEKKEKDIADILKASEKFFKRIAFIFIIYIIVLCFIYPKIMEKEFESFFTISLVIIISISTFAEYYFGMTYRIFLHSKQENYVVSMIQIITTLINTILVIILVRYNLSIQIVKLVSSSIFIMRPILQNIYVKKKYKIDLKNADRNYILKQKWDGLAQHIASVIHTNTDMVILTFFSTMVEVSIYSVYLTIINGIKKIVTSLTGGIDASFGDMIAHNEKENLNEKFRIYETIYISIVTIIFSCTFVLIIPFIKIYTNQINDAEYVRKWFAFFIVLAEYCYLIRLPYNTLILAAGHFKETRIGAWVEAGSNLFLSIILVRKYGLVGIAIGTLVAMFIRTVELIIHCSDKVLKRKKVVSLKKIIISILEILIIICLNRMFFVDIICNSYYEWIMYAIQITIITCMNVICINWLCFKNDLKYIVNILNQVLKIFKRKK